MEKSLKKYDPTAQKAVVREVQMRYGPGYTTISSPKKKKKPVDLSVMPTGVDDGRGARRLLHQYVEEAVVPLQNKPHYTIKYELLTDEFRERPFLNQITHHQMDVLPLLSHLASQASKFPSNDTSKKRHYVQFAERLRRDDTHLIRARLNEQGMCICICICTCTCICICICICIY
jgi:hypothetical protein